MSDKKVTPRSTRYKSAKLFYLTVKKEISDALPKQQPKTPTAIAPPTKQPNILISVFSSIMSVVSIVLCIALWFFLIVYVIPFLLMMR